MRSEIPRREMEVEVLDARKSSFRTLCFLWFGIALITATVIPGAAAQDYMQEIGRPTFTSVEPVELGFVDAGNGNLHLEITLGTFPQRGKPLTFKLVYDSRIWVVTAPSGVAQYSMNSWASGLGGWRLSASQGSVGQVGYSSWGMPCGSPPSGGESGYNNFYWTAPDGTRRYFPFSTTSNSSGTCGATLYSTASGYASDSSGYYMSVSAYNHIDKVLAPDGTQVYPTWEDTNGNKYSADSNGNLVDTLGRTPVITTVGNGTNGCGSGQICYDSLTSQGGTARSRVIVSTATIPVHTAFAVTNTSEYSGNMTVVQSITLPDNSTYQFSYDQGSTSGHYGELLGITLPTTQAVSYNYTVYSDALNNKNRWVTQRGNGSGTWTYVLGNVNTSNQTQNVTITKPSGDYKTFGFMLKNGAWVSSVTFSSGTTINETWDTSNSCAAPCTPPLYIRRAIETTSLPMPNGGTITKQSQFAYSGLNHLTPSVIKEWNYYSGSAPANPSRITNVTYLSDANSAYATANIFNLPSKVVTTDGSGNQLQETDYGYDGTTISSKTGIIQHDDTNYGTSNTVRGNRTSISKWTGATSPAITVATVYYDMTGQMASATDANSNSTTFDYTDCFLTGNPPSTYTPTTPTNAYLTTTTLPVSGTLKACYYFNTGKTAWTKDQNGAATSHFFVSSGGSNDAFDREVTETFPIGWMLNVYTSQTQQDTYLGIQDATASIACSSCRHDKTTMDKLGRVTDRVLASDPDGQTTVHTDYDSNGRVLDTSHPYRSTSDPTYGFETVAYDAQDRPIQVTHQDGTKRKTYYGDKVGPAKGLMSQQCGSNCALGYPTLSVDEMGKMRQTWTDAFGHVVEVDEPAASASPTGGTPGTGSATISGSEGSTIYTYVCGPNGQTCQTTVYESGYCTVTVSGVSESAQWGQGVTAASQASAIASAFNSDPHSVVTATASGGTVTFTGADNYSLSAGCVNTNQQFFPGPGTFSISASGSALTGATSQLSSPTVTYYVYDLLSNLKQITVVGSQECNRSYTHDTLSRLTSSTEPELGNGSCTNASHTTNYYYTKVDGNSFCSGDPTKLCRRTDGRGITTTYTYDAIARQTGVSYSDATPPASYFYDQTIYNGLTITNGAGRRTGMSDGSGATAWSFDANGNIVTERRTIAGVTKTIAYAYNSDNSLKQMTYPSGRVVNFTVSNAQRVTSVVDSDGTQYAIAPASGAMYAATGGLLSTIYAKNAAFGGVTETRSYNNRLQFVSIRASSTAGTSLDLTFGYTNSNHINNNGEIMAISNNVDTGRTQNLTYDDLSRISTATSQATSGANCWGQSFTIDAVANLTGMTATQCSAGSLSSNVNANNQFISPYTYDAAGNMTGDGTYTYAYNGENEMTAAGGVTYTYDGNRMRVEKSNGTLYWRSTTGSVISETNLSGVTTNEYVFFAGRRIARRDSGGNVYYYQADHSGTTRAIVNSSGVLCYDADFTPYGQEMFHTNSCAQNYKFTGYERDTETGLDYAMNRFYNPRIGRFMTPDPAGLASADFGNPQSMNRYAYVLNNPVHFADPLGYECVWDDGSYDSEFDPQTGGVGGCQSEGGTWIELGQDGNWSSADNPLLADLVDQISNGQISLVTAIGRNGSVYGTGYNHDGTVSWTDYGGWVNTYNYGLLSPYGELKGGYVDPNGMWIGWARKLQEVFGSQIPVSIDPADAPSFGLSLGLKQSGAQQLANPCTPAFWYWGSASFYFKMPLPAAVETADKISETTGVGESFSRTLTTNIQLTCNRLQ